MQLIATRSHARVTQMVRTDALALAEGFLMLYKPASTYNSRFSDRSKLERHWKKRLEKADLVKGLKHPPRRRRGRIKGNRFKELSKSKRNKILLGLQPCI